MEGLSKNGIMTRHESSSSNYHYTNKIPHPLQGRKDASEHPDNHNNGYNYPGNYFLRESGEHSSNTQRRWNGVFQGGACITRFLFEVSRSDEVFHPFSWGTRDVDSGREVCIPARDLNG